MKNKILIAILSLALILLIACQQAAKEVKQDVMEKVAETPQAETTGEAVVDSVGNDLNTVNSVEQDLSDEQLGDLDSGLADIEKI